VSNLIICLMRYYYYYLSNALTYSLHGLWGRGRGEEGKGKGGGREDRGLNLALVFLCSFRVVQRRDWLGKSQKWPVLCWVGCKTLLSQSVYVYMLCALPGLRHIHCYWVEIGSISSMGSSTAIYWCGLCECSCSDNIDCVISHVCDQQHRTNYMVTCFLFTYT